MRRPMPCSAGSRRPAATGASALPWFLWVHYYDPHAPYEPPADLAERFRRSPYDGEIAFVDRQLARLLQALDVRSDTARTLVLVTADHGESLGEHGEGTHGIFVYDATLRVPWVMAGPRHRRGPRGPRPSRRSIDVLPTLADYAGLPPRSDVEGRSLRPAADGREMADDADVRRVALPGAGAGVGAAARLADAGASNTSRLRSPELYDLEKDASETTNRAGEERAQVEDLGRQGRSRIALSDARRPRRQRSTPRPQSGCARSATRAAAGRAPAAVPRSAIPRTASACCRGSIAACPRRDRSPSSPYAS